MASRKRILIVANRFYPQVGGAEIVTFFETQELAKHFDVDVITPLRDNDARQEVVDDVHILRVWNMRNPLSRLPYRGARALCPSVVTRIMFGGYDLVHCFPALNRNNLLACMAARLRGIPVYLTSFDAFDYSRLINEQNIPPCELDRLTLTERQNTHFSRFNAVFTISERETRLLRQANPNTFLSKVPIKLDEFQNEPDIAGFRAKYGVAPDKKVLLCLSRVANIKGQDILLRALPLLKERRDDFVALIVGTTAFEPEYDESLKAFVRENGLESCVIFTGGVPREDALAALRTCTVHVLPMRFMNSGAVVIETWASRRPVVQSRMIDPNYVTEGETGFTFDTDSPQDLADKIERLFDNLRLCDTMGENGRRLVEREFLYSHLIEQYMDVYERCGKGSAL